MATIITKNSGTASSVPTGAQLTAGELAVNTADKRLFTKNGGGTVVELGTNPSSLTLPNGTANGVPYLNASKVLTSGSALTFDGTNFTVTQAAWQFYVGANFAKVQNTTGTSASFIMADSTDSATIKNIGSSLAFINSATENMRLTSTGLGIGTSSVTDKLTVAGNISTPNNNGFSSKFTNGAAYVLLKTDPSNIIQLGDIAGYSKAGAQLQFFASGSVAATFDQAGNLGLGVTPTMRLDIAMPAGAGTPRARVDQLADNPYYELQRWSGTGTNYVSTRIRNVGGAIAFDQSNSAAIGSQTFTQAMTLDASGNLLVGATSRFSSERLTVNSSAGPAIATGVSSTASSFQILFCNPNGGVGSVTTSGTSTAFNTSSDYRLKENVAPMTGALAKVAALKPVTYTWKADGSAGEGFIAHELAEVCPAAVTGEKDAVDAEGKPVYQGIDTSFLVATLTAAIQEQQAIITALTDRITALEAK